MENFLELISQVWDRGFLGIDLGSIITSLGCYLSSIFI